MSTVVQHNREQALRLVNRRLGRAVDLRRFTCLDGCAQCCRFHVSLRRQDLLRLAAGGCDPEEVTDPARQPARGFAAVLARGGDGHCRLLGSDRSCTAYAHRPASCRAYPFIREAYVRVQLDVDLSCPGTGAGARLADEHFAQILDEDGSPLEHAGLLESHRASQRLAERMSGSGAGSEPFEEVADALRSAMADRAGPQQVLADLDQAAGPPLLPGACELPRPVEMEDAARDLLEDYLGLWLDRQTLWRWADAARVVLPLVRTRRRAIVRFCRELTGRLLAEALRAAEARGRQGPLSEEDLLAAIRAADSEVRSFCQRFDLQA